MYRTISQPQIIYDDTPAANITTPTFAVWDCDKAQAMVVIGQTMGDNDNPVAVLFQSSNSDLSDDRWTDIGKVPQMTQPGLATALLEEGMRRYIRAKISTSGGTPVQIRITKILD